jgi:hypothetical protein
MRRAHGDPPAPMPAGESARHRNGGQHVISVNTLFWKILVTRVKRKMREGKILIPLRQLTAVNPQIRPERRSRDAAATRASRRLPLLGRRERRLCPDARSRRHQDGGQRVISVNTLFWKILVTRVKRKMQ